ncbi:DNA alkylation repair protein [Leucobacter iarius]
MTETNTATAVREQLAALEDPRVRAVNERHGDSHGVNLTKLRAVAKAAGRDEAAAAELWSSGDVAAQLVAILMLRPKDRDAEGYDAMLREAGSPKAHDWLVAYLVKKSPSAEPLRQRWIADPDPVVASAGWALTTERVAKQPEGLDLDGLLDTIEAEMRDAPDRLQWAMNSCLGEIGIRDASRRARVLDIGERLGVLEDYPTPPGCVSPYVPIWVPEIVRRNES